MLFHLFRKKAMYSDGVIDLVPTNRDLTDEECGITGGYTFYIYPSGKSDYAGYISLREGESPALYYLGHIGYRVDEKFRGNHYALRACRLLYQFAQRMSFESLTITANPDNIASRRTCEELGCIFEKQVSVPEKYRYVCSDAVEKCRYIWVLKGDKACSEEKV